MRVSGTAEALLRGIRQLPSFECGSEEAKGHFGFDKDYVFLNHGKH